MGNIKDIPTSERPYEKMLMYGESALTNSELLSIIIKTGTKEKSSIEIAQEIMSKNVDYSNSLRFLQTISIQELSKVSGIGTVKAIELKAVGEIAKRISKPLKINRLKIKTRDDVVNLFMEELQNEKNEVLKIVMLDNKNIIKKISCIAVGNENNIFTTSIRSFVWRPPWPASFWRCASACFFWRGGPAEGKNFPDLPERSGKIGQQTKPPVQDDRCIGGFVVQFYG